MKTFFAIAFCALVGQVLSAELQVLYSPESLHLKDTSQPLTDLSKFAALCFGLTTDSPQDFDGFHGYRNFENIPSSFIAFQSTHSLKKLSQNSFPLEADNVGKEFSHISNLISSRSDDVFVKKVDLSSERSLKKQLQILDKQVLEISQMKLMNQLPKRLALWFNFGDVSSDDSSQFNDAIVQATKTLRNALDDKVVLVNINDGADDVLIRKTRAAAKADYNLAYEYSTDYHTAFATIGFTTIVLVLVVFGVSVAMWNIDPGRDSIIYRLTAQKMKKDQ